MDGRDLTIRTAGERDREAVTRLLDVAFQNDPVSSWVFPDPEHRRTTHKFLMGAFLDIVLSEGRVDLTEDGDAVALWLSIPDTEGGADGAEDDGPAQFRAAVDPDNERVEIVARLTGEIHPEGAAHEYLLLIAVHPDRQGEGLGTALMRPVFDRCDRDGVAAYLEASSERSRELYEKLGFRFMGRTVDLPDGPPMWPMWRAPRSG
ncbi:GNAT family N-acetyltransferase [Streptomyces sp. NPDC058001]|uniref:GNAT family N-acetyltransferase n=1 Tax=Streptomyces sp. NPDC058001 TaxID=3346300 RepID=UPI0036EABCF4